MIAWIRGTVKDRFEDRIILDQNGIGYEIQLPTRIASHPMGLGEEKEFYIYTYVREDVLSLFGFSSWNEREIFLQLIKVSGVGAKTALTMLSSLEPSVLVNAIINRDLATLQSVKGIGRKAAEKIVIELADRMKQFQLQGKVHAATLVPVPMPHQDVISALMNLGYKRPMIEHALSKMDLPDNASFDQLLRESLKMLDKS